MSLKSVGLFSISFLKQQLDSVQATTFSIGDNFIETEGDKSIAIDMALVVDNSDILPVVCSFKRWEGEVVVAVGYDAVSCWVMRWQRYVFHVSCLFFIGRVALDRPLACAYVSFRKCNGNC